MDRKAMLKKFIKRTKKHPKKQVKKPFPVKTPPGGGY